MKNSLTLERAILGISVLIILTISYFCLRRAVAIGDKKEIRRISVCALLLITIDMLIVPLAVHIVSNFTF